MIAEHSGYKILLLMSGSIACQKASQLITRLSQRGDQVKVACTDSVYHFVSKDALLDMGALAVHENTFDPDAPMAHIDLSRWADLIVLCPATANTINKLVCGLADDMVSTTWIAAFGQDKPMVVVPAMNTLMYQYPATQRSLQKLQTWGIHVLATQFGSLACGEIGEGRMLEVDQIMLSIDQALGKSELNPATQGKNILITSGGTREYIDGVRYIGNLSSGRTGAALADYLSEMGHQIWYLCANSAIEPECDCHIIHYDTFSDLDQQLQWVLGEHSFDAAIHAAAVSDYSVDSVQSGDEIFDAGRDIKLPSGDAMTIRLTPNPKLLTRLKNYSDNNALRVIAFKLTNTMDYDQRLAAVNKILNADITAVIHNDVNDMSDDQHPFTVYATMNDRQQTIAAHDSAVQQASSDTQLSVTPCACVHELSQQIDRLLHV